MILTSTDLNIKSYVTKTTCAQSQVWQLSKVLSGVWFFSTEGVEGNPCFNTNKEYWFKIEKADNDYVLSFCPLVCQCQTLVIKFHHLGLCLKAPN
ncbi:kunitz family trypsin and protease inhibitor protein [Medicago truncatula]|uniref:Kunitz family trypsin and protease inhibitor protein n=1 Tax=Medicago truncatula TaxID=3880 RepID=G7KKN9_MEDTR|nr:kunitz family trypsin and protease inhibitor protein [Medicago truncatula]